MASAWGNSWSAFWGNSWGDVGGNSGGWEHWLKYKKKEHDRLFGNKLRETVDALAREQADRLEVDQRRVNRELRARLKEQQIAYETNYLKALNERRTQLIHEEIAQKAKALIEENNTRLVLLLGAIE